MTKRRMTSIRLSAEDDAAIEAMKRRYGAITAIAAIRLALRIALESPPRVNAAGTPPRSSRSG